MKYLRIKEVIIALSLTFLIACGDNNKPSGENPPTPTLEVQSPATVRVGESKEIEVKAQHTDFTVSENNAGCSRISSESIRCEPHVAGQHTVRLTTTAQPSQTKELTVNVPAMDTDGDDELTPFADTAMSDDIVFYAAEPWKAEVKGPNGEDVTWIGLIYDSGTLAVKALNSVKIQAATGGESSIEGSAGKNNIRVILDPNYKKEEREAIITIALKSDPTAKKEITVKQSPTAEGEPEGTFYGDTLTISINLKNESATLDDEPKTFIVTVPHIGDVPATDFEFYVLPAIGADCNRPDKEYVIVCKPTAEDTYKITVIATENRDKSDEATLTVAGISITPMEATVDVREQKTFTITAKNTDFDFVVLPSADVDCNRTGTTIACTPAKTGTYEIKVTAKAGTEQTVTAVLTVRNVEISIEPTGETNVGVPFEFPVTVTGAVDKTFEVSASSDAGCVGNNTKVTCTPAKPGRYEITVTATADTEQTDTATLEVKEVIISITPSGPQTVALNKPILFTVEVTGASTTGFSLLTQSANAGCVKDDNTVKCTPTGLGTHTFTVKADTADKEGTVEFTAFMPETDPDTPVKIPLDGTPGIEMVHVKNRPDVPHGEGAYVGAVPTGDYTFLMGCTYNRGITDMMNVSTFGSSTGSNYCPGDPVPSSRSRHKVTLDRDFYIGIYAVTEAEWEAVMEDNPSNKGDLYPVTNVSWDDINGDEGVTGVKSFIKKLNALDEGKGWKWRLPTEAEWEYAAGGGHIESNCAKDARSTYTCMFNGSNSNGSSWSSTYSGGAIQLVNEMPGTFPPNELGLYNMAGNVKEWVQDIPDTSTYNAEYGTDDQFNPTGGTSTEDHPFRIMRGGSYKSTIQRATRFVREQARQDDRAEDRGFRLVLELTNPTNPEGTVGPQSVKTTSGAKTAAPQSGNNANQPANDANQPVGFIDGIISGIKSLWDGLWE